jgi:DNA polymerase
LTTLHVDVETRSTVDLRKTGVYVYAADPSTDVWCMAYAFGDGPVELWKLGEPCPPEIADHVASGGELAAWNAAFERTIWRYVLSDEYGWPEPALEQWRCVMVEAYALSLPGSLGQAAAALGLPIQKDMEGHALMMRLARPRRYAEDGTPVWWEDTGRLERLYAYCKQDVETERAAGKRLLRLSPPERDLWLLDQRINDRGVWVDGASCVAAQRVVKDALSDADRRVRALTHGAVGRCSETAKLTAWLASKGVSVASLAKGDMADLLARPLPDDARAVLELRALASKTSTAKITSMLERRSADGRMRGNLQFHGAGTGRWAGRGAQCVTGEHEVLTPQGWRRIDETPSGVTIMQWSPEGVLTWVSAEIGDYGVPPHVARISGTAIRGVFTLDHRLPNALRHSGVVDWTPERLLSVKRRDGFACRGVVAQADAAWTDAQIRLLVALQADGTPRKRRFAWRLKKARKIERLRLLLAECGIPFYERRHPCAPDVLNLAIRTHDVPSWLSKGFGAWVLALSSRQCGVLLDEVPHWDGFRHQRNGAICLMSPEKDQVDWVATAAALAGRPGTVEWYACDKSERGRWAFYERSSRTTTLYRSDVSVEGNTARVYCPTTPTGYWLCRYGDRIFPTGNCQNLPRPSKANEDHVDAIMGAIGTGRADVVEALFGSPLQAVSDVIRGMIAAPPGRVIMAADFSNIEGRGVAWLAGEQSKLARFREFDRGDGPDIYLVAAAAIYNVPIKDAKPFRQIGKVAELACIAKGQAVLTDAGLVPIERVTREHKVWDGVEFVAHSGVVYRGIKEVIRHDGLTATPDHVVWAEGACGPVLFGDAASSGQRLVQSGAGRRPLRVGGDNLPGTPVYKGVVRPLRADALHGLRAGGVDRAEQSNQRKEQGLPSVLAATDSAEMVVEEGYVYAGALYERERRGMAEIRGAGHMLQLPLGAGGRYLDSEQSGAGTREGHRPNRQQRPLRGGEPSVRNPLREYAQSAEVEDKGDGYGVGQDGESAGVSRHAPVSGSGLSEGSHRRTGVQGGSGQEEELAGHSRQVGRARVYDILNAGPRHRFTVSGKLVHNCGYGGGVGAFSAMAKAYGLKIETALDAVWESASEDNREAVLSAWDTRGVKTGMARAAWLAAELIKLAWRQAHPMTVALWRGLEDAAVKAVQSPGSIHVYRTIAFRQVGAFLFCRLPSGRSIAYPYPRVSMKETPWGKKTLALSYKSVAQFTRKWEDKHYYGGLASENVTQAVARDVMAEAMLRVEAAGYPVTLTVHDEIVAEPKTGFGSLDAFNALMSELPAWAEGFPIAAAGWAGPRYRK